MNLGIDVHDTLTAYPEFFRTLAASWPGQVFLVSGTPESDASHVMRLAKKHGIFYYVDGFLLGFDYDKSDMDMAHFDRMKRHKLEMLRRHCVSVYFDDNPIYADFLRDQGIMVFQPALSTDYLNEFADKDPYFTAHFQRHQFDQVREMAEVV